MLEWFESIDRAMFLFINARLASVVTDWTMPVITNGDILAIGYGLTMIIVLVLGGPRFRWLILFSILTLILTDQFTAGLLKPIIQRPRPCHPASGLGINQLHLLVSCGAGYAMPSTHAANAFGQAILFGLIARPWRFYLLGLAALVGISRVFVGVHFPGDVIIGALIGSGIAYAIVKVFRRYEHRLTGAASPSCEHQNLGQL